MTTIKELSNIETIILGDFNIDFNIFSKNESEKINYEKTYVKKQVFFSF